MITIRPFLIAAPLLLAVSGAALAEGENYCLNNPDNCRQKLPPPHVIVVPVPVPVYPRHVEPRYVPAPPIHHHHDRKGHRQPEPRRTWYGTYR